MPSFQVKSPYGSYEVTAPDEASALAAVSITNGRQTPDKISVTAPNGDTVDFPTGTDANTIGQVMAKHWQDALNATPKLDKYQQAAAQDIAATSDLPRAAPGYASQFIHGATLGADTALMAAAETPLEMIKRGTTSPVEGYNYAKAREDASLDQARQDNGLLGTGMEMAGGVVGAPAAAKAGLTVASRLAPEAGIIKSTLANAGDAALQGGIQGFNEGNGISDRLGKAVTGAVTGAGIGGGLSAGGAIVGGTASKIGSALRGHFAPEAAARSQIARAVTESGMTPGEIENAVTQAAAEGQPQFNVADAMGNSGQRLLSTAARANGPGRTDIVNSLEARQAGQGRRVANALAEGFDAPTTAAQTREAMTNARNDAADTAYGAVRTDAQPVDVVGTINHLDNIIGTQPGQQLQAPNDSVEAILRPFRERLARVNPDDFAAVQRIRGDMSDAAQNAAQNGYGNRARLIRGALGQLDTALENSSAGYLAANRNFAQASRNIDAIDQGRTAAMRGRTEDTIPAYNGLTPEGQTGYRAGYVDPLIEAAQGGAYGVNKARPLTSDAFRDEAAAMAPGNDLMQRRIGRENTMFQTRNTALGGSKTADNLADQEAMGIDPTLAVGVIGHLVHGNVIGAAHALGNAGMSFLGNTPAVRAAVGRYLLQNGATMAPGQLQAAINQTMSRIQRNARLAATLGTVTRSASTTAANRYRNGP